MSKTKRKKSGARKKRARSLNGIEAALAPTEVSERGLEAKQLGMGILALAGANAAGSILLGNHAIWPAAIAMGIGIWKKNLYWTMAGAGLFLANGYQKAAPPSTPVSGTEDEGFSLASFTDQAKERAKNYLSSFAEKLYLPQAMPDSVPVSGLNGEAEEVKYFINPYTQVGEVDTSELDKLQMKVESMNGADDASEIDTSERNF